MKAYVLAAVLAAFTTIAPAGASRDVQQQAVIDKATAVVIADAGRLGSTSLTSLNGSGSPWAQPALRQADAEFEPEAAPVSTGTLLIAGALLAAALARPLSRALRRQEEQRRAAALASTLGHGHRG